MVEQRSLSNKNIQNLKKNPQQPQKNKGESYILFQKCPMCNLPQNRMAQREITISNQIPVWAGMSSIQWFLCENSTALKWTVWPSLKASFQKVPAGHTCRWLLKIWRGAGANARFWYTHQVMYIACKTFICHLTKYFNFDDIVFSSPSIHTMPCAYAMATNSGQFSFFFLSHFSVDIYLQDRYLWCYHFWQQTCEKH